MQAIKGESMLTRFEEVKEGLETSLRRIAVLVSQELNSQVRACVHLVMGGNSEVVGHKNP